MPTYQNFFDELLVPDTGSEQCESLTYGGPKAEFGGQITQIGSKMPQTSTIGYIDADKEENITCPRIGFSILIEQNLE